ncbi:MAG: copper amine oxidase family protein [Clostridia bacterium]|jgi:hypothetical protein|nr:copper amine oxidase family protein [Clostridia bacterium]
MKLNKILTGFLSVSLFAFSAVTAFAADSEKLQVIKDDSQTNEEVNKIYFNSFTGVVKQITESEGENGLKYVLVQNEEGQEANLVISEETYILGDAKIAEGDVVTGFYDPNLPMIMIYPPQYKTIVAVVQKEGQNVKVDVFDEELLSADKLLKLNISPDTEIILQDGTAFKGELTNRKLVVVYGAATKSIPAQTTPSKIVVLFEDTAPLNSSSSMQVIVNEKLLSAEKAYINEHETVMVPLRAAAESAGFKVEWDEKLKSVMLGEDISLTINKDYYTYMNMSPIKLGTAPILVEGKTFVPINFFKEVAHMDNAYILESQVVIENE